MDIGPDPEPHHHIHTGRRWLDTILAVSAITLSVISAIVALQNGRAMDRMVQANSWPDVLVGDGTRDPENQNQIYRIMLINNGVGPAKIESLKLTYKGQTFADMGALVHRVASDAGVPQPVHYGESDGNTVIPARDRVDILLAQQPRSSPELIQALTKARNQILVSACYCSIFEECWRVDSEHTTPIPTKACPTQTGNSAS